MIPADSVEFHEDQLVFHAQGEVVYVVHRDQLRAITWYAKQPNPALARRRALWPNHGTRWTDDQRTDLRHRLQQGQTWRTISTAAGRSRTGCQQEAVKQGWIDAETLIPLPALLTDDAPTAADSVPSPAPDTETSPAATSAQATEATDPAAAAATVTAPHDRSTALGTAVTRRPVSGATDAAEATHSPSIGPNSGTAPADPNAMVYQQSASARTPHLEPTGDRNADASGHHRSEPSADPNTSTRPKAATDGTTALRPGSATVRQDAAYSTVPTGITETLAAQQATPRTMDAIVSTRSPRHKAPATPDTATHPSAITFAANSQPESTTGLETLTDPVLFAATTTTGLPQAPATRADASVAALSTTGSPATLAHMSSGTDPSRSRPAPPTSPEPDSTPPHPPRVPRQRTGSDPDTSPGTGSRFLSRAQSSLARATLGAYMSPPKGKPTTPSEAT